VPRSAKNGAQKAGREAAPANGQAAPDGAPEPSATKRLTLPADLPLSASMERALAGVVRYAQDQVARAAKDPEKAVHEFRKSARRARAVVKLWRPTLGAERFQELNDACRQAVRETSSLRDADVLLAHVVAQQRTPETQPVLDALEAHLRRQRDEAQGTRDVDAALRAGAALLASLPQRFADALPAEVGLDELQVALAESFRRARRARKQAKSTRSDDALHAWRKRTKELRYQLELLSDVARASDEHTALASLAEELGQITDRIVLRTYAREHKAALRPAKPKPLTRAVQRQVEALAAEALRGSKPLFSERPREFARRVTAG